MRKLLFPCLFFFMGFSTFAQVQRKITGKTETMAIDKKDQSNTDRAFPEKAARWKLIRQLNLTTAQKLKLKEMQQQNKSRKEEILNNGALTKIEKEEQLKEIKKSRAIKLQGILDEEQRLKLKKLGREKRNNNNR